MTRARDNEAKSPKVLLKVTPRLVRDAVQANSGHCMIAEAVKEAVPGAKYVSVDLQTIRWTDTEKGKRYVYLTPRKAQFALIDFDQGEEPTPFQATIQGAH